VNIVGVFFRSTIIAAKLTKDGPIASMPLLERAQESVRLGMAPAVIEGALTDLALYLTLKLGPTGARQRVSLWASRLPASVKPILAGEAVELGDRKVMWTWEALAVVCYELGLRLG